MALHGPRVPASPRRRGSRNESRKRQAKSWLARGHSIVCHPGRRNCACAILESRDPVHFLRLCSWVPGLASGLARDDNPPVALHRLRVPAGSAKSEHANKRAPAAVRVGPSLAAGSRNESRKRQAKSWLARGHSIVCHPGRRNCACAISESRDPVHFLRLCSWVPGLARGLARDDNPPVALHHPRVPAGSAKQSAWGWWGGHAQERECRNAPTKERRPPFALARRLRPARGTRAASDKQRVGWRVRVPSFVIPAGEIARAQFWRAGTQYTSFACVPGSRVSQEGSPGMTILRSRCITRAFRPAPRSKRAWGWWGGHAQERECRNAPTKERRPPFALARRLRPARGTRAASDKQRVGCARGHSIVCHPGRRNCACAILESRDPVHFLRLRSWVPGLASGLARDDNPPVALHHPRVPAGSAKSESERASKEHQSRCITRAFRPAPRSKRAWGWWGGHAQERECRNAQTKERVAGAINTRDVILGPRCEASQTKMSRGPIGQHARTAVRAYHP